MKWVKSFDQGFRFWTFSEFYTKKDAKAAIAMVDDQAGREGPKSEIA